MHHIYKKNKFILFTAPMLLLYIGFSLVPILMGFMYSFTEYDGLRAAKWNDFANYKYLLEDKVLIISLVNTIKIAVTNAVLVIPTSFMLAFALAKTTPRNNVYKTILFAPYVLPGAISGLIWFFMLEPSAGLINSTLRAVGLDSLAKLWIGGDFWTPFAVGVMATWGGLGYYMILWQLGIKNISADVLEASLIDGCNKRQQITKIVLPLLKGTVTNICIFVLSGALGTYSSVYVLTGGGPNHLSETLISYMYVALFKQSRYGYGMAVGVLEFAIAITISLISLWLGNRRKIDV